MVFGKLVAAADLWSEEEQTAGHAVRVAQIGPQATLTEHNLALGTLFSHLVTSRLFTETENERAAGQCGYLTPHSLRHYFVTKVLRATGDLRTAQKLARHKAIVSTQRYAHVDDGALDKAYEGVFGI